MEPKELNNCYIARLAQSVERETFNLKAWGSSPQSGAIFLKIIIVIKRSY
jgi:hypothetical protein